ncbi:MAG: hypothetical protein EOP46_16780, partial [Sphingobacteriaceae bacterium]
MKTTEQTLLTKARRGILIIIIGLTISGITAFPLQSELKWLITHDGWFPVALQNWLTTVHDAIWYINIHYLFLSYGTDWLA